MAAVSEMNRWAEDTPHQWQVFVQQQSNAAEIVVGESNVVVQSTAEEAFTLSHPNSV